jgi:hypothetical protein
VIAFGFAYVEPVFAGPPPPHVCDVYSVADGGESVIVKYGDENLECQVAHFAGRWFIILTVIVLALFLAYQLLVNRFVEQQR